MENFVKHYFTISYSKGYAIKGKDEIIVVGGSTHVAPAAERKLNNYLSSLNALKRIGTNNGNVTGQASGFHDTRSSISKFLFLEIILDP
jgi:NAD-dependent SIR2 family protein deacetylase